MDVRFEKASGGTEHKYQDRFYRRSKFRQAYALVSRYGLIKNDLATDYAWLAGEEPWNQSWDAFCRKVFTAAGTTTNSYRDGKERFLEQARKSFINSRDFWNHSLEEKAVRTIAKHIGMDRAARFVVFVDDVQDIKVYAARLNTLLRKTQVAVGEYYYKPRSKAAINKRDSVLEKFDAGELQVVVTNDALKPGSVSGPVIGIVLSQTSDPKKLADRRQIVGGTSEAPGLIYHFVAARTREEVIFRRGRAEYRDSLGIPRT
jgi:hypothetical protein